MRTRSLPARAATGATLTLAACGGDDGGDSTATDSTDATTSTSASAAAGEMTAGEFMEASLPDEVTAIKQLVAEHPEECEGISLKGDTFYEAFAIDAAMASPDTPLSEIIGPSCQENLAGKGTA